MATYIAITHQPPLATTCICSSRIGAGNFETTSIHSQMNIFSITYIHLIPTSKGVTMRGTHQLTLGINLVEVLENMFYMCMHRWCTYPAAIMIEQTHIVTNVG